MVVFGKLNYKYGLVFTQAVLLAAVIIIALGWSANGGWVRKAVDLSGGTEVTFKFSGNYPDELEGKIAGEFGVRPRMSRSADGGRMSLASTENLNATAIAAFVKTNGLEVDGSPSVQSVGPALGSSFWKQAQLSILFGFIFMGATIYAIYRSVVPSMAIMLGGFSNMVETIAVMNILGMEMSLAGIAALLMLIGYSVDTNVVLTTRLLKREFGSEDFGKTLGGSVVTGLTMSFTAIAALLAMVLFSPASVITQIASILIIGLVFDVPNTWLQNASILRWHLHA